MFYYEVIFAKSFRVGTDGLRLTGRSKAGKMVITTITEVVQSGKFNEHEAEMDANNKIEKHPLAKAGWYWAPPQRMTSQEVRAFRKELRECQLSEFEVVQ